MVPERARSPGTDLPLPYNADMLRVVDLGRGDPPPEPASVALDPQVIEAARAILRRVRSEGDRALVELTREHDGADVEGRIVVPRGEMEEAKAAVDPALRDALDAMAERLEDLHARQVPAGWEAEREGIRFGEVVRPIARVGCYVPGGRATYPSSMLMTVVPAVVAGVPEVFVCTPPAQDGSIPPPVLYAASRAGADVVYRLGGAQAIAAMAYGTETVTRVEKVVGPGNAWVTAAKREVMGSVGVDALAGPTELVIVADASADPEVLAVDLVAQCEHDPQARATLICLDPSLPARLEEPVAREVEASPRREVVEPALAQATAVLAPDDRRAAEVVDRLAPEHLQVVTQDPPGFLGLVRSFGAAFLGPDTPVSLGDYGVGSNHVLPTMATARFASGLRASDFVTVSGVTSATGAALARYGPEVATVARAEGLEGHARAVEVRR